LTLSDKDYVASGGEKDIYQRSGFAFNLFQDPKRMIPATKIDELRHIQSPFVLTPDKVVFNSHGQPVGYTTKFLNAVVPICKFFTKSYKTKNNIGHDDITEIVKKMQDIIQDIHAASCLVVDLNEMNILMENNSVPYFIDVGGYQTPGHPATAIMESIRDPLVTGNQWTDGSDWFSFAIITFQLWIGIHPYKGTHPVYKKDWKLRMANGASVFDNGVVLPQACYPLSVIPGNYRDWMKKIFVDNERCEPPATAGAVSVIPIGYHVSASSAAFNVAMHEQFPDNIMYLYNLFGVNYAVTSSGLYRGNSKMPNDVSGCQKVFVCSTGTPNPAIVKLRDGQLVSENHTGTRVGMLIADDAMYRNNCVYMINEDKVTEVSFRRAGNSCMQSTKMVASVMPSSTKVFDGVIFHNMVGHTYMVLPYDQGVCFNTPIKELDGYRIIDARSEGNVCVVIAEKKGIYDRFIIVFGSYPSYTVRKDKDVQTKDANLTVMPNGVVVVAKDDSVELSMGTGIKVIDSPPFDSSMRIFNCTGKLFYLDDDRVMSCSMSK